MKEPEIKQIKQHLGAGMAITRDGQLIKVNTPDSSRVVEWQGRGYAPEVPKWHPFHIKPKKPFPGTPPGEYAWTWELFYSYEDAAFSSLCAYQDKLYIGAFGKILVFDGTDWAVSTELPTWWVHALCEYDGKLYAATFTKIYVYDGSWSESFSGAYSFFSLGVYNGKLFAGTDHGNIFVYNGSSWTLSFERDPAGGVGNEHAIAAYDGNLYVGANHWYDGSYHAKILIYNGSTWAEHYTAEAVSFLSLAVYGGSLYAGSGNQGKIYVYNGSVWLQAYDTTDSYIYALAPFKTNLYAGTHDNGEIFCLDGAADFTTGEPTVYGFCEYDEKFYAATGKGSGLDGKIFSYQSRKQ